MKNYIFIVLVITNVNTLLSLECLAARDFRGTWQKSVQYLKKKCLERVHVSVLKHSKQSGQKEITDPNSRRVIL